MWCGAGDDAQRSATEAYLAAHRASITAVSPTIYGVSPTGQLTIDAGGNTSKQSPEEWAASLHTNHGLRVVPIIYADDSHNPVGLQKLRLLAANPAPFTAALVAQAKRPRPAIPIPALPAPAAGQQVHAARLEMYLSHRTPRTGFGWREYNLDLEECHMDAKHLKDCHNRSTTDADSAAFIGLVDRIADDLHAAGIQLSVDVDSRVHRQPNPDMFFK